MRVEFLPAAREERRAATQFLENRSRGLGARFSVELKQAIKRIASAADSFPPDPESSPDEAIRYVRLTTFPYRLAFHIVHGKLSLVLAVIHDAQRPGSWRSRL